MMGKKDLDKLFQEKFTDFHELPDKKVWERLEASLDEKKKKDRKVIPIWWKLGGVAAVLALFFYAINPFGSNTNVIEVTDTENKRNIPVDETKTKTSDELLDKNNSEELTDTESTNDSHQEVPKTNSKKSNINPEKRKVQKQNYIPREVVATIEGDTEKASGKTQANKNGLPNNNTNNVIVKNDVSKNANQIDLEKEKRTIVNNKNINSKEAIAETDVTPKKKEVSKKSILEEIKEEEAIAENRTNKWSLGASVAPVYFNTLDEGSPIHQNFVGNSKSGNVNMSYGLSVAYKVGKKLSIRSGIHKVDYGYNTNDVIYTSAYDPESNSIINSIDYDSNGENIMVESKNKSSFANTASDFSAKTPSNEGEMIQQFGYVEVPVELNYAVTDGKFGVNIIGGVSSLFLVDNSISLESGNLKTDIGEANNINSLNFSTNVGLGLNYKVTPKIQLNVEPVFKYQLNTFSNSSGNFQPFSLGVYSGLSFKF